MSQKIVDGDTKALKTAINRDKTSRSRKDAEIGQRYYDYKHDILNKRIWWINDNDEWVEDKMASNRKIPHPFFTEIIDQAVSTELANPIEIETDDESFTERLDEYWGSDTHLVLQEASEGQGIKGKEFVYAKQTAGEPSESRVAFQVSDSLQTFEVADEFGNIVAVVRYYTKYIEKDGKETPIMHAEVWTAENVTFYVENEKGDLVLNRDKSPNPRTHMLAEGKDEEGNPTLLGKSYGRIPFFKLKNNKKEKTDLEPIKEIIDDYDVMNAYMSDNLQDFQGAIYVTEGYQGDDLGKLKQNVRAKGAINVDEDGSFNLETYNIPVEGRIKKMDIDKQNIYKFGMAFDSTQVADNSGNVTNVQIMAGYSLLMMKLKKKERYLLTLIDWMNELITEDINRRYSTNYQSSDIKVTITPELIVNKQELEEIERIKAETKQTKVNTLLDVAMLLPQEQVLREVCDILELDWNEVQKLLLEEHALSLGTSEEEEGEEIAE